MGIKLTWKVRLERAKKRGYFTNYEKDLSENWRTCAIGERFTIVSEGKKLPKDLNTSDPRLDREADDLGLKFYHHVAFDEIGSALETYEKIQQLTRVSQIFPIK
jgi:hypothetical protein